VEFQLSDVYQITRATRIAMAGIGGLLFTILISTVGAVLYLYRK